MILDFNKAEDEAREHGW